MSTKRKNTTSDLFTYLTEGALTKEHFLTPNGAIKFHWSNWKESCFFQRDLLRERKGVHRFKLLERELAPLKEQQIFLKRDLKVVKTNLYDLYVSFLDPKTKMAWDELYGNFLVSLSTEAGPYVSLSSMRWFDKELYASFVYKKILNENINLRNLRLGVDIPMECCFDGSPFKTANFNLEQIAKDGVIIKINGAHNISRIDLAKELHLSVNLRPFEETMFSDATEILKKFSNFDFNKSQESESVKLIIDSDILDKYNNRNNSKFASGEHFYLYVPYTDIHSPECRFDVKQAFANFVYSFEDYFRDELDKQSFLKAA